MAALDHRPDQASQGDEAQDLAGDVQRPLLARRDLGHEGQGQGRAQQAERQVDQEHPAPAQGADQQAADHRSGGDRHPAGRRPPAHGPGPRLVVAGRGVGDQGQGRRHQQGGRRALDGARQDQLQGVAGQAAGGRGQGEQHQARQEGPARSEPVAQRARRQQQRRQQQGVGVDHPLQAGGRRAELAADGVQGHVDDGHVQLDDREAEAGGQQDHRQAGGTGGGRDSDVGHGPDLRRGRRGMLHARVKHPRDGCFMIGSWKPTSPPPPP